MIKAPIRIGLAGLGRAGWGMHCEDLAGKEEQFCIVAACDPIASRREKMKQRYGCRVYEHIEEMINDPDVELVDIATRSTDHYIHGRMALSAGKHVFMEKPLSLTYDEALLLQEAAAGSQGELFVRHNRRFDPDFLHIQEIMASGILGDVYQIKLCRHGYQRRDDWQTLKHYGGGQLLNWGPHIIDHALQLLESPVLSLWSDLKQIAAAGDAEDHVKIILKGTNERVVDLEISGGVALRSPEYTIYGNRGSLVLSGNEIQLRYLDPDIELAEKQADAGTPGETFGNVETLAWVEQTIQVNPARSFDIWNEVYASIRQGAVYPIKLNQAVEVMRIINLVKQDTRY